MARSSPKFELASLLITKAGFEVSISRYDEAAFGSWFIELETTPRLRLVWDGREGWLIVQKITGRFFSGMHVWDDLWVDKHPQTPHESLLSAIEQLKRAANNGATSC